MVQYLASVPITGQGRPITVLKQGLFRLAFKPLIVPFTTLTIYSMECLVTQLRGVQLRVVRMIRV